MAGRATATGARAYLGRETTADELCVDVSLFATLQDGRRVALAEDRFKIGGPRTGIAAVWVHYLWSPGDLGFGEEPPSGEALQAALEEHYTVRAKDVEDAIREELFHKPEGVEIPAFEMLADELEAYDDGRPDPDELRALPFAMEFDDMLLFEMDAASRRG